MFHNGEASYLCLKPRTNPLSFSLSIILFPHSGVKGITSSRKHNSQWTVLCRGSFALAYLSRETWANVIEQCQHWRVVQSQLFKMRSTCRASVDLNRQGYDINSTRGRRETVAMYTVVCVIQDSVHYSFIHFGFKWFKGNTEESSEQVILNRLFCMTLQSALNLILPGGWQFLILWHPESQTGLHTSWCLCLPVETLQTVKYFKQWRVLVKRQRNVFPCGHTADTTP